MRYIYQHIHTIIDRYEGETPLHLFLKNYFKKQPILGSRDRKMLAEMAFVWYRCSRAFDDSLSFGKKLEACLFTCETNVHQILQLLKPEWQGKHDYFLPQKISLLEKEKIQFHIENLFPFDIEFSEGIAKEDWLLSMLRQPDLFIRYRKNPKSFIKILNENKIPFSLSADNCFALPNATKLDTLLPAKDYVVQNASSQKTGNYFHPKLNEDWWDCCCGAGGKSILLKDIEPKITLTVSDKRATILHNLTERFRLYFNSAPESIVMDITDEKELRNKIGDRKFGNIICDVPCSGSGTWARTPEQLYFFDNKKIAEYSSLQKTIVNNALQFLKPKGRLIYITCSVFKEENENVINQIQGLKMEHEELINGVENKADSMFVTVLQR